MIVQTLAQKCERKLPDVFRSALVDSDIFPWDVPISKSYLAKDLSTWRDEVEQLKIIDKTFTGAGPRVEYQTRNTRLFGSQSFPSKIVFDTREDFLTYMSLTADWILVHQIGSSLKTKIPELAQWFRRPTSYKRILENRDKWTALTEVCLYFQDRDQSQKTFAREVPLKVPTKFIEENTGILRELLDAILPPDKISIEATDFFKRFMLQKDESRVRVRALNDRVKTHLFGSTFLSDVEIPISELDQLLTSKPFSKLRVFIVENLTTFLTFPEMIDSILILGGGFFVSSIQIKAFNELPIFYWGDLDVQGLEILALLRRNYPQSTALLMDECTLNTYADFWVPGEPSQQLGNPKGLLENETFLYEKLKANNLRLEQERIPSFYLISALSSKNAINSNPSFD